VYLPKHGLSHKCFAARPLGRLGPKWLRNSALPLSDCQPSARRPSMSAGGTCPACATGCVLGVGLGGCREQKESIRQVDLDDRPALNCLQRSEPRFCLTIWWSQGTEARRCYGGQKHVKNYDLHMPTLMPIYIYICM
jgi:hypothetical protein